MVVTGGRSCGLGVSIGLGLAWVWRVRRTVAVGIFLFLHSLAASYESKEVYHVCAWLCILKTEFLSPVLHQALFVYTVKVLAESWLCDMPDLSHSPLTMGALTPLVLGCRTKLPLPYLQQATGDH